MNTARAYQHVRRLDTTDPRYQQAIIALIFNLQKRELFAATVYGILAKRQKDVSNRSILEQVASVELKHQATLEQLTQRSATISRLKVMIFLLASRILGYTFVLKMMEKKITFPMDNFIKSLLIDYDAHFEEWFLEEEKHEQMLLKTLDEARLRYISSMVLGLNDALIEITATLAGFSLSMSNNRMIWIAGMILGVSATLSMAASEYLSNRSENNPKALQAALLCGLTYVFVTMMLLLPYFIFPVDAKMLAVSWMLVIAFFIILIFNFYLSITKDLSFKKRFSEMLIISTVITMISFGVGYLADNYLNTSNL
ncbi:VIT1/CCC1 transporter family protein [Entomospira culicis]|uniref:Rubrerythrin family protein n=1 Tax=Entomospira culicis TaxID=2719989 RepID=A0A968GJC9_9SPIO|nr:VIT1/CCC1 transporter family protein [Entomospira culicis]NIZ19345.1 rubrerythrin family protein [Entomospira culicis]NIZ69750.1 rubrerythrin family protein [Entomospira culicis]WDI36861.1 VIT1/CCC1 transporter family protein [Entomospira culicis]WDI38490.1 VIT1/CCC1 transporter family protein [Entomospira culicis]